MKWLNARDLYRDLAKWEEREPFTTWFEMTIQPEFKEGEDWRGEIDEKTNEPVFWITQAVADQIAKDDAGPPVERMGYYTKSAEFRKINWNQRLSEQTHAITGDEEI